ncbi:MAG: hypothetical protein CMI60_14305 [Parvibaculum sp.]|nr:hypothetical protein [Parvibaculum sp.]|tara:strand:+ start:742 stop:1521 length:780 start_codon:yes stop_codon:yes gene_type:complete
MAKPAVRETDLYAPLKSFLEGQGYEVKSEIGAVDVMAQRGEEDPLIVEMKTGFTLSVVHQAIARQSISDIVYIAIPRGSGATFRKSLKANMSLCRRLGLGLITIRLEDGFVETHADPGPYVPRKSKHKKADLLHEFGKRTGDPNKGGSTRRGLMTAYRQDALRCLQVLSDQGPTKAARVSKISGVEKARRLMADNHYGWFERIETGIYSLSKNGRMAVQEYQETLAALTPRNQPAETSSERADSSACPRTDLCQTFESL